MTGIIGALSEEIEIIINNMENRTAETVSRTEFHTGTIGGEKVCAAVCGMGKVNAAICAQTMITRFGIDRLINTGIGGALDPSLRQRDLVIATGFVQHDMDITGLDNVPRGYITELGTVIMEADSGLGDYIAGICSAEYPGITKRGIFATGDQFIADRAVSDNIRETFGASVCDMESGAMAQACVLAGIPFAAVRCISDSADSENSYYEFKQVCCERCSGIVLKALRDFGNIS